MITRPEVVGTPAVVVAGVIEGPVKLDVIVVLAVGPLSPSPPASVLVDSCAVKPPVPVEVGVNVKPAVA